MCTGAKPRQRGYGRPCSVRGPLLCYHPSPGHSYNHTYNRCHSQRWQAHGRS